MAAYDSNDPIYRKRVGQLSSDEMRKVISELSPEREMHAGVRLLNLLLEDQGVLGVIGFVEKGHIILDEEGKLLEYDFVTDLEKRLLKRSHPNIFDRRTFLHTVGWGVAGAVGIPYYSSEIGDKLWLRFRQNEHDNALAHIHGWIGRYLVPGAELLISASLLNEMVVNWRETKLEEVSNVVAEAVEVFRKIGKSTSAGPPV
ncbi:MAG TPA: hypothetical protein VGN17_01320 [Bryobacteraceae bacterium]|jgi:hypothetical protein